MAQGATALLPSNGTMALGAVELHEILECERIVQFRDAVLAGAHPRIKVPAHLNGKNVPRNTSSPNSLTPRPNPVPLQLERNAMPTGTHVEDTHTLYNSKPSDSLRMSTSRPAATLPMAKAEINPILLEKSEDLIKAEIQLQRQRLERALREQVEQRRLSFKASLQTLESLPDFDISDVLSKALTLVHPSTAAENEQATADHASASDSFDENTFYSSQHDTPEQSILSQDHSETSNQSIALGAIHSTASAPERNIDELSDVLMANVSLSNNIKLNAHENVNKPPSLLQRAALADSQNINLPPLSIANIYPVTHNQMESAHINQNEKNPRPTSQSAHPHPGITVSTSPCGMEGISRESPRNFTNSTAVQTSALLKRKFHEIESSTSADILEPPIVRTRDDVPTLAPQPARVSPLATARVPPVIGQSMIAEEIPSLRAAGVDQPSAVSSPDSSAKGAKPSERKKKRKKARKSSGKQPAAVNTPDSPFIKTEPRSPSPFSAAPLPRPLPRQRNTLHHGQELNYDEPRYDISRGAPREPNITSHHKAREVRAAYDRPEDDRLYEPYDARTYEYRRSGETERQERHLVSQTAYRPPSPPSWNPLQNDSRPIRAASHAVVERNMPDSARYYRDVPPRASVRADADRERSRSPVTQDRRSPILMAPPPRLAPTRIMVDEYGREYYAPSQIAASSPRQPLAPAIRSRDEDLIYERASIRPMVRPVTNLYNEDGVVYRRPSPQLAAPRRVVTQPEEMDYRSYRQREYSTRPVARAAPSEEYVRFREPLERRQMSHFEEMPRESATRMGSVRPESTRYAMPREYITRVQSVRPEEHHQDYRTSVRPEPRREVTVGPIRDYSIRPGESEIIRREYMPPPDGAYAPVMPVVRRVLDDAEYIERRRDVPQDMYTDEVRREVVYR